MSRKRADIGRRASDASPKPEARGRDEGEDFVDRGSHEHYENADLYDYEYRRRRADVTFYRELAHKRGATHILELGAGSGRVTIPLARDGREVVAVDRQPEMLAKLRARVDKLPKAVQRRITIVEGDLMDFEVDGTFPLAIAAFNVIEHLYTRGEVDRCFRRVRAQLAPDGAFAFDVQLPDLQWLLRPPTKRWAKTRFTDPTTGRAMIYSTNHDYDPVGQIALIRLFYEPADGKGATKVVKLSQRKFFPAELEALVAHSGLRLVERYGDFSWRPLALIGDDAPPVDGKVPESQVLVAIPDEKMSFSDEDLDPRRSSTRKK